NTLFLKKRRDNQFDATLGLDWKYLQNWKLSPRLSYTKNHSNIEIDKYERTEVGLTVRREFR
ncbi:MAG: DUF560 domain-containing protein, partial [Gammaproteobacteria bacterium]|nr:DUF560 domain-containing protein [Gammaproteobacteria bacterium]